MAKETDLYGAKMAAVVRFQRAITRLDDVIGGRRRGKVDKAEEQVRTAARKLLTYVLGTEPTPEQIEEAIQP